MRIGDDDDGSKEDLDTHFIGEGTSGAGGRDAGASVSRVFDNAVGDRQGGTRK